MKNVLISALILAFPFALAAGELPHKDAQPTTTSIMADDPGTGGGHETKSAGKFPFPECFEPMFSRIEQAAQRDNNKVSAAIRARVLLELDFYRKNAAEFILYLPEEKFLVVSTRDFVKNFHLNIKTVPMAPYSPIIWSKGAVFDIVDNVYPYQPHDFDPYQVTEEQRKKMNCVSKYAVSNLLEAILDHIIPISSSSILGVKDLELPMLSGRRSMLESFANAILFDDFFIEWRGLTPQGVEKVLKSLPWRLQ